MDQADRLRDLVSASEGRARVIAVASGKGGVGKTHLAVNLALALSAQGRRVILVDVDIGLANADVLLGLQPRLHLGHVLAGEVGAVDALVPAAGGIYLLPGCPGVRHLSELDGGEREFLTRSFQELEVSADFILVDTGAGISRNVIHFSAAADEILVVTMPEPTAITDGYAVIKAISREKGYGRMRLVVNMATDEREAQRVGDRIRAVARRFLGIEVDYLGPIVADGAVGDAVRRRRPFLIEHPRSPAAACVRALAQKILADGSTGKSRGFFKRFASAIHGVLS